MPGFCTVFNCLNRTDREKDKSIHRFPSVVKNNGKEGLKLSKVSREKWLAQIFRKYLTERKLERTRTRIKIMLSTSPSSVFSQKVHNIKSEKQVPILPWAMVIKLGPPVLESFTRISKFYEPSDSEHKF